MAGKKNFGTVDIVEISNMFMNYAVYQAHHKSKYDVINDETLPHLYEWLEFNLLTKAPARRVQRIIDNSLYE